MGQIFGNLTRTGVEGPAVGNTPPYSPVVRGHKNPMQYFDSPGEAAISAAKMTQAPTATIPISGQESPVLGKSVESGGFAPAPRKPSFAEASAEGSFSPGLTTKGKILGALLSAAQGAALGAGQPTFGAGFERATLFPMEQKRRQQQIEQEDLAAQIQRQAIEQAPILFHSRLDASRAQAEADRARAGLYRDRENAPNTAVVGGRLVNRETGEVITDAPPPKPLFKGNPDQGIVQVNPDGTTKDVRPPNPKPQPTPKPQKSGINKAHVEDAAARFFSDNGNDPVAALAAWDAYVAANTGNKAIVEAADAVRKNLRGRKKR